MKFNYQARTKEGEVKFGKIEAKDKESVFKTLKSYGLYPTVIEEDITPFYLKKINLFQGIKKKDISLFSRKVSIIQALSKSSRDTG